MPEEAVATVDAADDYADDAFEEDEDVELLEPDSTLQKYEPDSLQEITEADLAGMVPAERLLFMMRKITEIRNATHAQVERICTMVPPQAGVSLRTAREQMDTQSDQLEERIRALLDTPAAVVGTGDDGTPGADGDRLRAPLHGRRAVALADHERVELAAQLVPD
jgi:hypothetical protein